MQTFQTKGSESTIKGLSFTFLGKKWVVALSGTKWHDGERFKKMPIWFSSINGNIPALFIHKLAIGFDKRK